MSKFARVVLLFVAVVAGLAMPAMAQATPAAPAAQPLISFGGAFGAAFTIIGAGYGIGRLAAAAVESMARQPEVAGRIQTAMIIAAALIEGATFFALIICITAG